MYTTFSPVGTVSLHMMLSEQSPTLYGRHTMSYCLFGDDEFDPCWTRHILSGNPHPQTMYKNGIV